MIKTELYEEVLFQTVKRGATEISEDVREAFTKAIEKETSLDAKRGLRVTLESMDMSAKRENPLCVDTGWPIFYFKVGNDCKLEGGFVELENAARRAVARATEKGYLRATMKHPLTGYDPGNNIGMNIPDFTYKFVEGDGIEISYAAKGGGSECFGGTRHRIVAFADGIKGIEKFVIDSFVASARAGAVCPPSVLGIGIGGTANVAANLARGGVFKNGWFKTPRPNVCKNRRRYLQRAKQSWHRYSRRRWRYFGAGCKRRIRVYAYCRDCGSDQYKLYDSAPRVYKN